MLRRILTGIVLSAVGLFAVSGVASAAPGTSTSYADGVAVTVVVSDTSVAVGAVVNFTGSGFTPGEVIIIVITYGGPNGLRSSHALHLAAGKAQSTSVADAAGGFSADVSPTQAGIATITATGQTSGHTASIQVAVAGGGVTPTLGTTTVAPPSAGDSTAIPAAGGSDGSGLASTGVSIAGPLTAGAGALTLGLALLFFGTRLAIRRRQRPSANL